MNTYLILCISHINANRKASIKLLIIQLYFHTQVFPQVSVDFIQLLSGFSQQVSRSTSLLMPSQIWIWPIPLFSSKLIYEITRNINLDPLASYCQLNTIVLLILDVIPFSCLLIALHVRVANLVPFRKASSSSLGITFP